MFRPQSVAAHFPLMIAFQGHPDKGTERVDMGLFLIKAYIGGWYDSKSFPTDVFSRWLDSPPGVNWKGQGFTMKQIAYNLHGDTNSIEFLHSLYADLVSQGVHSQYFLLRSGYEPRCRGFESTSERAGGSTGSEPTEGKFYC